jgi:hypothetical protein
LENTKKNAIHVYEFSPMTAHSSNRSSMLSIRHVAIGFLERNHIILVVTPGIGYLVSCRIDPELTDPDICMVGAHASPVSRIDQRFGLLNSVTIDKGFPDLADHVSELRAIDAITEPVRWCCRDDMMKDLSWLPDKCRLSAKDFQIGTLADLPTDVKTKVVEFSEACRRPRKSNGVGARLKRITVPNAA